MRHLAICLMMIATLMPAFAADATPSKPIDQMKWMLGTWEAQEGAGADAETVKLKAWLETKPRRVMTECITGNRRRRRS